MKFVKATKLGRIYLADCIDLLTSVKPGSIQTVYIDPPFQTGKVQKGFAGSYLDNDEGYRLWLIQVCKLIKRVLSDTGVLFLHLDQRESHSAKLMLDRIFRQERFINEIIWCYSSGGASKRSFAKKHDNILVYSKTKAYKWNPIREPYPRDYGDRPGFHKDGRVMNDWWQIGILSTSAKARTGYPNQKPPELIRRCIAVSSDPGDVVLDCFVGSGTTALVAEQTKRRYIVGDKNRESLRSTLEMLQNL
jgi:DNA modification methylase